MYPAPRDILHRFFFRWVIFTFSIFFFSIFIFLFLLLLVLFLFLFPLPLPCPLSSPFFFFFAKVQFLDCCAATVEQWAYRRTWRNGSYSTSLCFPKRRFCCFCRVAQTRGKKKKERQGWPPLLPSLARYLDNENPGDDTIRRISKETSIRDFIVFSFLLEDYAGLRDRGIIEIERRFYFHRF